MCLFAFLSRVKSENMFQSNKIQLPTFYTLHLEYNISSKTLTAKCNKLFMHCFRSLKHTVVMTPI